MGYEALALALTALAGYLLGSINSSIIFTWFFKNKEDIRKYGSGNAGMTNVLRSVGKLPAALTFVGDFLKCVAALLLSQGLVALVTGWAGIQAGELYDVARYVAGVACVLGHIFPVYYGFRGGKGVVTSAAMIALTDWRVFLLVLLTFAIVFAAKRIVSLASVICAYISFSVSGGVSGQPPACSRGPQPGLSAVCHRGLPVYRADGGGQAQGQYRAFAPRRGKAYYL